MFVNEQIFSPQACTPLVWRDRHPFFYTKKDPPPGINDSRKQVLTYSSQVPSTLAVPEASSLHLMRRAA